MMTMTLSEQMQEALDAAAAAFATTLAMSLADSRPWLSPEHEETFERTIKESVLPVLVGMAQNFPAIEGFIQAREELTFTDLFGGWMPSTIGYSELSDAISTLESAAEVSPLNEAEQKLLTELERAKEMSGHSTLATDSGFDEELNEQLQRTSGLPSWLDEPYIDWEPIYERIKRDSESVEIDDETYLIVPD